MVVEKTVTLADIRKYFTDTIYDHENPESIPLMYPEACRIQAQLAFDEELKNPLFLSGNMPANVRAEFVVLNHGGYAYKTVEEFNRAIKLMGKYLTLAERIILAHRQAEHGEDVEKRIAILDATMRNEGVEFTEYEQTLIDGATTLGFWGPDA